VQNQICAKITKINRILKLCWHAVQCTVHSIKEQSCKVAVKQCI